MISIPDDHSAFIRSLLAGDQETFAIPADFDWIIGVYPGWRNDTFGRGDFGPLAPEPITAAGTAVLGDAGGLREITLRGKSSLTALFRFAGAAESDCAAAIRAREAAAIALSVLGHPADEATRPVRAIEKAIAYASPTDYPDGTTAWWIHHCLLEGARLRRRLSRWDFESRLRAVLASDPRLRSFPANTVTVKISIRHWPFDLPHSSMSLTITHAATGEPIVPSPATVTAALVLLLAFTPITQRVAFKMPPAVFDLTPHRTRRERRQPIDIAPAALAKALAFLRRRNCSALADAIALQAREPAIRGQA
ncbi:hypothetical protein ACFPOB_18355 [Bosea eneae]|uniref:Uncharacterized protein n=1 Tax=Bosea eneae TaxID=151454 RepID=A0ABW0J085_9HYPH